jgi:hypothetical protein
VRRDEAGALNVFFFLFFFLGSSKRIAVKPRPLTGTPPPAQIRACATNAPGSCVESDVQPFIRIRMDQSYARDPLANQLVEAIPGELGGLLASAP